MKTGRHSGSELGLRSLPQIHGRRLYSDDDNDDDDNNNNSSSNNNNKNNNNNNYYYYYYYYYYNQNKQSSNPIQESVVGDYTPPGHGKCHPDDCVYSW